MKLRCLPWLLFFIWANGFICLGLETYPAIEYANFNFSTANFRGKEIQGLNKRIDLAAEGDAKVRKIQKDDMLRSIERGKRGRGGFGGANIAHGRPRKKSAAASLVRPDLSVSAASLVLILILPSAFLRLV